MNRIHKLTEYFAKLPGIGPRQAKRFVYFLLTQPRSFHQELADLLLGLHNEVSRCGECHRFFATNRNDVKSCNICIDSNRENTLMVVEKDVDLDNIERSNAYKGYYFVLGGTVPILEQNPEDKVRSRELVSRIKAGNFNETILALSANPDGDNTASYLLKLLESTAKEKGFTISKLGRGLSTGSELEYSDTETIKNAFTNRG